MTTLLFVARYVNLAQCVLLVGAFGLLLMAGPAASAAMRLWERWVLRGILVALAIALASGVVVLAAQAAAFEGRPEAALEPGAILRGMFDTWSGVLWSTRMGLLSVLSAFVVLGGAPQIRADALAARIEGFALAALALVVVGAASHAAAGSPASWPVVADVAHVLAAGLWAGALPPLALLLLIASRGKPELDPAVIRTMRRFSRLALGCVLILAGTGVAVAWQVIGGPEGLLGTTHGHLLLAKLTLLAPALLLAALSRAALPDLASLVPTGALTTARRMALFVAAEAALVLAVIGFAVAMSVTTPALHDEIVWPLPFRLSSAPSLNVSRLAEPLAVVEAAGSALALAVVAWLARRRPVLLSGGLFALLAAFATVGLWPLLVHATPASYARPPAPYSVESIVGGKRTFEVECAACHAGAERGDACSLASASASRLPGDLFWDVTNGTPHMRAFEMRLSDAERWRVVHYLKALGMACFGKSARSPVATASASDRAWLAAPDFSIAVGPLEPGSLSDLRGRKIVLLVLYDPAASGARMSELAKRYGALSVLGVEVVAVPPRSSDAIAELGQSPPVLFPVVTDGAEDIVAAYRLFAPGSAHAEFLIDRAGYIRAVWRSDTDMPDTNAIQSQVERLNAERPPPPPDDHIH